MESSKQSGAYMADNKLITPPHAINICKQAVYATVRHAGRSNVFKFALPTAAIAIACLFSACGDDKNDPIPEAPVQPEIPDTPVAKNDTAYIVLHNVADFAAAAGRLKNTDSDTTYIVDLVSDFPADSADFSGVLSDFRQAAKSNAKAKTNWNDYKAYPPFSEKGVALKHADWDDAGKPNIGMSPVGQSYFAATSGDSIKFRGDGQNLNVLRLNGGLYPGDNDAVLHISGKADLAGQIAKAKELKKAFISIDADLKLNAAEVALFETIADESGINITGNGKISPSENNEAAKGAVLLKLLPALRNGEKRFFVSGENKAALLGGSGYFINTDSISGSRYENGEVNLSAKNVFLDKDGLSAKALETAAENFQEGQWAFLSLRGTVVPRMNRLDEHSELIFSVAIRDMYRSMLDEEIEIGDKNFLKYGFKYSLNGNGYGVILPYYPDLLSCDYLPKNFDLSDGSLNDIDVAPYSNALYNLLYYYGGYFDGTDTHFHTLDSRYEPGAAYDLPPPTVKLPADKKIYVRFTEYHKYKNSSPDYISYYIGSKVVTLETMSFIAKVLQKSGAKEIHFVDEKMILMSKDYTANDNDAFKSLIVSELAKYGGVIDDIENAKAIINAFWSYNGDTRRKR